MRLPWQADLFGSLEREAAVQEKHRIEAEDGGGMLATWNTRYAGLGTLGSALGILKLFGLE